MPFQTDTWTSRILRILRVCGMQQYLIQDMSLFEWFQGTDIIRMAQPQNKNTLQALKASFYQNIPHYTICPSFVCLPICLFSHLSLKELTGALPTVMRSPLRLRGPFFDLGSISNCLFLVTFLCILRHLDYFGLINDQVALVK